MNAHVLSVGQCSPDDARIGRVLLVEAHAHMARAHTAEEARRLITEHSYDLILVNRVFDADAGSGLDFIAALRQIPGRPPVMLISDLPDMQAAARAQGAIKGFGKSQLGTPEVGQTLREALHSTSRAGAEKSA